MTTITSIIKLEVIKPINTTWKTFGDILYTIQRQTREIMNKSIQYCWEFDGFSSDYKKEYGNYPSDKEILNKTLAGYIYEQLKEDSFLYTSNCSQSQQKAIKKWKSDKKEILKGERSIPNYKKDIPVDLHNKSIEIIKNENGYCAILKMLNKNGVKRYDLKNSEIMAAFICKDNSTKQILERVINKEYKIGGSQLIKHKKKSKWFLNLTYSFESVANESLDKNNIMGIDMGICNPVYIAFNNSLNRFAIEGDEISKFRKGVEARRNSLLRQGKYCGEGRKGHGTKTMLKPIEKLQDRVNNFKQTTNHKYSKKVIELALKNKCGVIQMEDLTGIASNEKKGSFLGSWTYFDLQTKIENKAKVAGIEVRKVKPSYTSQRCSKCGFIHTENRPKGEKGQSYFECVQCGYKTHADYNAAKNISMDGIEEIIKEQIEFQKNLTNHALKYVDC